MPAADSSSFMRETQIGVATGSSRVVSFAAGVKPSTPRFRNVANAPLASLAGDRLAHAFHAWRGISGRRYTFAVSRSPCNVGDLGRAVVIVAEHVGRHLRALFIGLGSDVPASLTCAGAATELHYHLLAMTSSARNAVIGDLLGEA